MESNSNSGTGTGTDDPSVSIRVSDPARSEADQKIKGGRSPHRKTTSTVIAGKLSQPVSPTPSDRSNNSGFKRGITSVGTAFAKKTNSLLD